MNDKDKTNKAKLVSNSELTNEYEDEQYIENEISKDQEDLFSFNFTGFKIISGWWILIFFLISISIPIGVIYLIFLVLKSFINLIF